MGVTNNNNLLLIRLSAAIFFLLINSAAVANAADSTPYGQCDVGDGGDVATAVSIKESLIQDLMGKVAVDEPGQQTYYCNVLTWNGLQMFGFAECTTRGRVNGKSECRDCLDSVGPYLIKYCTDTGAGHAWDLNGFCYFKVGFSYAVCPPAL